MSLRIDEQTSGNWYAAHPGKSAGFNKIYSDTCIQCALRIKSVYRLSLRAAKGFIESVFQMIALDIKVPCYSTFCRRQQKLNAALEKPLQPGEGMILEIDSTGLKVYGEGEWKTRTHGYSYHRVWRKLHIAIDAATQQIQALSLSTNDFKDGELLEDLLDQIQESVEKVVADGAYDSYENGERIESVGAEPVVPPREGSKISRHGNSKEGPIARDEVVREIKKRHARNGKAMLATMLEV